VSYFSNKIDDKIIELLKGGGVGLLPTDTIYGLSALALNEKAVGRVHELKQRDDGKPLVVLIDNIGQLAQMGLSLIHAELVKEYWPGPLSLEFDATAAPSWLHRGKFYFAVRMPDNNALKSLLKNIGPIVSSSANIQGHPPAKSVEEAKKYFGEKLNFYVDVGKISGQPSTLAKIENGKIEIIRQGAYEFN
jgi:L-threonylcarbamoyladenylate synthase